MPLNSEAGIMHFKVLSILFFLITSVLFTDVYGIFVKMPDDHFVLGERLVTNIVVSNPSDAYKAVEVGVSNRAYSLFRKERLVESDEFIIIPAQFVLAPRQDRTVTIKWAGSMSLKAEKPFRVVVEEVLFKEKKEQVVEKTSAKVRIRLKFVNSFYVRPKGVKPKIVATALIPTENGRYYIDIKNEGSKHRIISKIDLGLGNAGNLGLIGVSPAMMNGAMNVLPGEVQRLVLSDLAQLPTKSYTIETFKMNP
ncbi:MAG: P pilus assembly chaperone PapD [Candidatus Marinamargulisbacteria bacterium]|jgi:P pilus assembly chaperone PapD